MSTTNPYKRRAIRGVISLPESRRLAQVAFGASNTPGINTGDLLPTVIDDYTGEPVEYQKTSKWLNGSVMTDGRLFNGLFYKLNEFYYRRILKDNTLIVEWFGISTANPNNAPLLQALHDYLPGNRYTLKFRGGTYANSTELNFTKPFFLLGEPGTTLGFVSHQNGLKVQTPPGVDGFRMKYINIQGINTNNRMAGDDKIGLRLYCIAYTEHVTVSNFSGHCMEIYAAVGGPTGTNASLSIHHNLSVQKAGRSGLHIVGPDANRINFTGVFDARDNNDFGVLDNSFLGNRYDNAHFNNNGLVRDANGAVVYQNGRPQSKLPIGDEPQGGPMYIKNTNARTLITSYYAEDQQNPSVSKSKYVNVVNVLSDTEFIGANILNGSSNNGLDFRQGSSLGTGASIKVAQGSLILTGSGASAPKLSLDPVPTTNISTWNFNTGQDAEKNFFQILGPGSKYHNGVFEKGTSDHASVSLRTAYIGGLLIQTGTPTSILTNWPKNTNYYKNTILNNPDYNGSNVPYWRCIRNGTFKTYSEGLTAYGAGNNIVLSGATKVLAIGETVSVGGRVGTITSKHPTTPNTYFVDVSMAGITAGSPIQYVPPRWKADGAGAGTSSQRPTSLTVDDAGWPYFNKDTNTINYWSGTAWV